MNTNLNLRIIAVRCKDETGGSFQEKIGNDEIFLGGFTVDANGNTTKISPSLMGANFDDGEVRTFSPPKIFGRFQLPTVINSPINFNAGFLLIEKDAGGMAKAVIDVFEKVKELIAKEKQKVIAKAQGAGGNGVATAAVVSVAFGALWPLVKAQVIKFVFDKITSAFSDDVFPLQDVSVTIPSVNHTFNGQKTSPEQMVEFRAHGGIYQLFYDWELV